MTKGCHGLTIHAMRFVDGTGPVFYASLPCEPHVSETLKHFLVSAIWDNLAAMEHPVWKHFQSFGRADSPIQVVRGLLGRPHLLLGTYPGPAISFSKGGGKLWAALCGDESDIGIDVAGPDEFKREPNREYPFHRVFHPKELQPALRLTGGDMEKASALLWSVKEAVVKALGCAFHLVDPQQIIVHPSEKGPEGKAIAEDGGYTFSVGLSGKALARFPMAARGSLWVSSLPQKKMWLSIALLNRIPVCP